MEDKLDKGMIYESASCGKLELTVHWIVLQRQQSTHGVD